MNYRIERFDKARHNRERFECEESALSFYLKKQLSQDEKRGLTRGYVLIQNESQDVKGFYTLSSFYVHLDEEGIRAYKQKSLKKSFSRLSVNMSIPSVLIGRLARDWTLKGTVAGDMLLVDALQRILELSKTFGIHFVVVDAKNEFAKQFYQKFGFLTFGSVKNRMYLPIKTVKLASLSKN